MTAKKALESVTSLSKYCSERYNLFNLTANQLARLVAAYNVFNPVDIDVWLKVQLIELGYFLCGCNPPPPVRLLTALHMNWSCGEILASLYTVSSGRIPLREVRPIDRHRCGTLPRGFDDEGGWKALGSLRYSDSMYSW
jgi:hypothetical protein